MTPQEIAAQYVATLQQKLPDANIFWELSLVFPESSLCTLHISNKNDPDKKVSVKFNKGLSSLPDAHDIDIITDLALRGIYPKQ